MSAYLKQSAVKALAKQHGRRVGRDFLQTLDAHVERKVIGACKTHNGGKITLDGAIASFVGLNGQQPRV